MPRDRIIGVRGLRLGVREWNVGGARPVLLLHGFLDHKASFDLLAPLLPPPLAPIAIDFPGHGDSDRRAPQGFYHFADFVADAVLALRALGIERAPILGHSLGGAVALLAAAAAPDAVERVVALEALGPLTMESAEAPDRLAQFIEGLSRSGRRPRVHPTREAALARLHEAAPQLPARALEVMLEGGAREVNGGWQFKHDPLLRVRSPAPYLEEEVLALLRAIRCPVLVVQAERSPAPFAAEVLRARQAAIPQLSHVVVPGVAHHLHLEAPEKIAELVAPFLLA